ncbi:plasmid mobilization relaxosome protein MobC [Nostoc sp. NIES-2111]
MTDDTRDPSGKRRSEKRLRQAFITVRCTPAEKAIAVDNAANLGLSLGDYVRSVAMGQKPLYVVRRNSAKAEAILLLKAELGKIGSNINQVAKVANSTGTVESYKIDILLNALRLCHEEIAKLTSL